MRCIEGQKLVTETAEDTYARTAWAKALTDDPSLRGCYGGFYHELNNPMFRTLPYYPKRMRWMKKLSDDYAWEDVAGLSEEDMDNLLKFYADEQVPEIDILKAMRGGRAPADVDLFDGSFGFSVGA